MKIIRNGKEYELTSNELYEAYLEKEHEIYVEEIEFVLGAYMSKKAYEKFQDNKEFIDQVANFTIAYVERKGWAFQDAVEMAVLETLNDVFDYFEDDEDGEGDDADDLHML